MLTGTFRYEFDCETLFSHLLDVLKILTDSLNITLNVLRFAHSYKIVSRKLYFSCYQCLKRGL